MSTIISSIYFTFPVPWFTVLNQLIISTSSWGGGILVWNFQTFTVDGFSCCVFKVSDLSFHKVSSAVIPIWCIFHLDTILIGFLQALFGSFLLNLLFLFFPHHIHVNHIYTEITWRSSYGGWKCFLNARSCVWFFSQVP